MLIRYSLTAQVSQLIDAVFRIPSWWLWAFSDSVLTIWYGPVRRRSCLEYLSKAMRSAVDEISGGRVTKT